MSILIKGMEMPKTEEESKLLILTPDGVTWLTQLGLGNQKFDTIEVPPHGRLIDADELIAKQEEDAEIFMGSTNYGDKVRYDEAMNAVANIVNAPTVIPADKDGET